MLGMARRLDKATKIRGKKKREKSILEAFISDVQLYNCSDISQIIFEPVRVFFIQREFETSASVFSTNGPQSLVTGSSKTHLFLHDPTYH